MLFVGTKSKQANQFSLDGFNSKKATKRHTDLSLWQKLILMILSGGLLALSTPGFDQWLLAWFMVVPLLLVLNFCRRNSDAVLVGLFFGLGYHLVSLHYYLFMTIGGAGNNSANWQMALLLWLAQAIMLSLPTAVFGWLMFSLPFRPGYMPYWRRPFFSYLLSVPLLWVFLHWGLSIAHPFSQIWQAANLPYVFIDPLAYSQYAVLNILQMAKWVGPAGLEFLLLLVNASIAAFILESLKVQDGPVERVDLISPRLGALLDLIVAFMIVIVFNYLGQWQITQAIARANYFSNVSDSKNEMAQPINSIGLIHGDRLSSWSNDLAGKQLALIIHPEPINKMDVNKITGCLQEFNKQTSKNNNSAFLNIVSTDEENILRNNLIFTGAKKLNIRQSFPSIKRQFSIFNGLSTAIEEWMWHIDKDNPSSWYVLPMPKINEGKVGLLSGSEITDSRLVAQEVRRGASLLISSSDTAWNTNRYFSKQILASAIFRAVENQRYTLVSTNSGLLAVIEPTGVVQNMSLANEPDALTPGQNSMLIGTVQFLWSKTPFTKMWWL